MPFAQIYMLEGRTPEQKRAVIEKVTQALVEAIDAPKENVRVWRHDVPKENQGIAGVPAERLGRQTRPNPNKGTNHDPSQDPTGRVVHPREGEIHIGGIDALVRLTSTRCAPMHAAA